MEFSSIIDLNNKAVGFLSQGNMKSGGIMLHSALQKTKVCVSTYCISAGRQRSKTAGGDSLSMDTFTLAAPPMAHETAFSMYSQAFLLKAGFSSSEKKNDALVSEEEWRSLSAAVMFNLGLVQQMASGVDGNTKFNASALIFYGSALTMIAPVNGQGLNEHNTLLLLACTNNMGFIQSSIFFNAYETERCLDIMRFLVNEGIRSEKHAEHFDVFLLTLCIMEAPEKPAAAVA